ncbi:hypothetical protein SO802_025074 [Lithocarpus litseifolius]|uniref:Uncharacterized protein n=1 Tax=Lithocarpus litseifolius TaxID=425828 RepID=A0AAW2BZ03_9ROSI
MDKRPSRKEKGKAPAVQPKQIRKVSAKISNKHEGILIEITSLQDTLLVEAMYSCSEESEILIEDMTDAIWLSNKATWYESFREAERVYDGYRPYPGLLINTETEDPVICDPLWLSVMLEAGFISKLILTYGIQISLFPNVIQEVAA